MSAVPDRTAVCSAGSAVDPCDETRNWENPATRIASFAQTNKTVIFFSLANTAADHTFRMADKPLPIEIVA